MNGERFFVFQEGEVVGPYPSEEIKAWNLDSGTQVCREGTEEWQLLSQVAQLLKGPSGPNVRSSPLLFPGEHVEVNEKKKIFIIHGRGNRMDDAFRNLIGLVRFKIRYFQNEFYVDAENSNFVRYIANDTHANPYTVLFDRIIVGKIALAPFYPPPSDWVPGADSSWTKLSDYKVSNKLTLYGVPMGALGGKREWCDNFFKSIWKDFSPLIGREVSSQPALAEALASLRECLVPEGGGAHIERDYKKAIRTKFASFGADPEPFIAFLIEFQRLGDAGGDLDTIGSNALYGAWILQAWEQKYGRPPQYGRDFEFDFVNYHQSFLHLARHKNCEIYLPDFPMEAIPDLEEAAKAIIASGSFLVRIDDHHPLGQERIDLLNRLKAEGFFGDYVMSGPVKGAAEQAHDEKTCGADLVHLEMIARRNFDSPGLEELRRLAHQQDLHLIEDPDDRAHPDYLAIDLSKLIGSKYSRIDMAQQLMYVRTFDDMRTIMETTGWRKIVDDYEEELLRTLPKLEACIARADFVVPKEAESYRGGMGMISMIGKIVRLMTFGKIDLELQAIQKKHPELVHRIFFTLAPFQTRKEHRINVASAIGYLKNQFRFDYFFFAWGSSLLTTRRFNDKDQSLDLSVLMPLIGGPGDGGHSSAATCKPPSNAAWPKTQFEKLRAKNFIEYVNYVTSLIAKGVGVRFVAVKMLSELDRDF